jgi:hypothetical protein
MRLYAVPARALREEKNGATRRALASHSLIKKSRGGASKKSTSLRNTVSKSCPRFDIGNAKSDLQPHK